MILPPLCPLCLTQSVVATVNGPTCVHIEPTGAKWWPKNYSEPAGTRAAMTEAERVAWLERKQK
jgi:hypothetical protein